MKQLLRDGLHTMQTAAARWGLTVESARNKYGHRLHIEGSIGNTLVYRALEVDQIAKERQTRIAGHRRLPISVKDD